MTKFDFQPTTDAVLVKSIITQPHLWAAAAPDGADADSLHIPMDHWIYVRCSIPEKMFCGLFAFQVNDTGPWEVHTALLKDAYGKAVEAARAVIQWIFDKTFCPEIITKVPEFNRLALRLAKLAGMEEYGREREAFVKNGIAHDIILFRIKKGATCH